MNIFLKMAKLNYRAYHHLCKTETGFKLKKTFHFTFLPIHINFHLLWIKRQILLPSNNLNIELVKTHKLNIKSNLNMTFHIQNSHRSGNMSQNSQLNIKNCDIFKWIKLDIFCFFELDIFDIVTLLMTIDIDKCIIQFIT